MKNLVITALATTCFVSAAFAETAFLCQDQNHVAELIISESRIENRSYNECNGGVGDEMTDCHTQHYQIQVRDADIAFKINEDTLSGKMALIGSGNSLDVSKILIYPGKGAIHMRLKGDMNSPVLNLEFRTSSTKPGESIVVGDYILLCYQT